MRRPKWYLITEVDQAGLIRLIEDLSDLYDKDLESPLSIPVKVRRSRDFGPYQVNILTKDRDDMVSLRERAEFDGRYKG